MVVEVAVALVDVVKVDELAVVEVDEVDGVEVNVVKEGFKRYS